MSGTSNFTRLHLERRSTNGANQFSAPHCASRYAERKRRGARLPVVRAKYASHSYSLRISEYFQKSSCRVVSRVGLSQFQRARDGTNWLRRDARSGPWIVILGVRSAYSIRPPLLRIGGGHYHFVLCPKEKAPRMVERGQYRSVPHLRWPVHGLGQDRPLGSGEGPVCAEIALKYFGCRSEDAYDLAIWLPATSIAND